MRLSSVSRGLLVAVAVAVSAPACDWRPFDKLKSDTPVLAVGAPGSFGTTDDFGQHLLPLSGPAASATGGRFLVSGGTSAHLALIAVDGAGKTTGQAFTPTIFGSGIEALPITSMVEIPGTDKVLLGAPQARVSGSTYLLTLGTSLDAVLFDAPAGEDRYAMGVAAGSLAGTGAPDFVAVSLTQLYVYVDGDVQKVAVTPDPGPSCPLEILTKASRDLTNRALLVAPVKGGTTTSQIVVGTPNVSGPGSVSVFDVDATTGTATCAFSYTNAKPRFGRSLAIGDFNADGALDLLVGAPPTAAFWIPGPLSATSPVLPVTLAAPKVTGDLGLSVAAGNVDGVAGDEALVADPDATVDGKLRAGEVRVVGGPTLAAEATTLRRQTPGENDAFGTSIRVLPFCASGCGTASAKTKAVPLVGSSTHAFGFFKISPTDTDPRTD